MPPAELRDPLSAMTPRFNFFFRWFAKRFFGEISLDESTIARLRALESAGSVVYVMRYASRLDYFLFNWLFLRHGLRLATFANGIRFDYYQPLWQALIGRLRALRSRRGALSETDRDRVRAQVQRGSSLFLFLRTERLGSWLRGRRHVATAERSDLDVLAETVGAAWDGATPVAVVPLALFWRPGPRNERRFLNLAYGAPTRPTDFAKVASFLVNYHNLAVKVADPIDLTGFVQERRAEGLDAVARKVRRSILVFLYREEKVVEGPTLRPRHKVQEMVLASPRVRAAVEERARERGRSAEAARAEAEKMFREIAANMNSTFLAVLNVIVTAVFRRVFVSIETSGLEKVAEYAKRHPIVLVPSHRSYFDFLLLSVLFYAHHLVPPHIAARDNMGFGPFGFIFRRAGAFFLRKQLRRPALQGSVPRLRRVPGARGLHAGVLHRGRPLAHRTHDGAEARLPVLGRGRLPRLAAPRSLLRADRDHLRAADRRGRRCSTSSSGGAKKDESMLGLVRARKVLRRRWGSAHVSFGEPISLADSIGDRRARFALEATRRGRRREAPLRRRSRPARGRAHQRGDLRQRHGRRGLRVPRRDAPRHAAPRAHAPHAARSSSCCACRTRDSPRRCCATSPSSTMRSRSCCAAI